MNQTLILYASIHHGNTRKVVDYVAQNMDVDIINIAENQHPDVSTYRSIILASGIYFNRIHRLLNDFVEEISLRGKRVAIVYTCGFCYWDYARAVGKRLSQRGAVYLGSCHCRGFDTFGPLKILGGIAKGHPSDGDLRRILKNLKEMLDADR